MRPQFPDLCADGPSAVRVDIGEGEAGAALCKQQGKGSSDAGGAAAGVRVSVTGLGPS